MLNTLERPGFVRGAWVARFTPDASRPQIARLTDVYEYSGAVLIDLVFYDRTGRKIGRVSPACGGPRDFEPACPGEEWELIEEPDFSYLADAKYQWGDRVRRIKTHNEKGNRPA